MREWWLRTVLVLQSPRAVFAALRDDSPEAAADRAEPVLLVVLLAGMALAFASGASGSVVSAPGRPTTPFPSVSTKSTM